MLSTLLLCAAMATTPEATRPMVLAAYLNVFGDREHGWSHWRWEGHTADGAPRLFLPDTILGPEPWRRDLGVGVAGDYPLLGPYHAGDPAVMAFHFACMRAAGIDGVLLYLYEDTAFYSDEMVLRRFLDEAQRAGLAVGFCDSEGELAVVTRFDGMYSDAYYAEAADRAARTLARYAAHPAYLRVDGKPFWMVGLNMEDQPARVAAFAAALRNQAGPIYLSVVTNAVHYMYEFGRELAPGWPKTLEQSLLTEAWAATGADNFTCYSPLALAHAAPDEAARLWRVYVDDCARWGKDAMVYVMSGYDDSNWRVSVKPLARRDGAAWRERLRAGLAATDARFLAIQCFNEWHEGALLEPNLGFRNERGEFEPFLNLRILAEELGVPWTPPRASRAIVDPLLLEHAGALLEPYLAAP